MTGSKPLLFAYFVKNRLPELIVAESLTFLHRDKSCFFFFFNNLPNVRQYWSAPGQFLFFFQGRRNGFSGRTVFPGNGLTGEDSSGRGKSQPSLGLPTVCFVS